MSNPYSGIVELFKSGGQSMDYRIGQVVSSNPLTINFGDLQINQSDNLMVNPDIDLVSGDTVFVIQSSNQQSYSVLVKLKEV